MASQAPFHHTSTAASVSDKYTADQLVPDAISISVRLCLLVELRAAVGGEFRGLSQTDPPAAARADDSRGPSLGRQDDSSCISMCPKLWTLCNHIVMHCVRCFAVHFALRVGV